VLRVIRLIQKAEVLRVIIDTLIMTLPQMANIGALLLLVYYIFAVLGMQLFSTIKL